MEFKDKKVVITGGARGIGREIVEEFRKRGAHIAVVDKEDSSLECEVFYKGDISEQETLLKFSKMVLKKFEKIDYLINNACLSKRGLLSDCSFENFNYVLQVGVTAPFMLTKLLMNYFHSHGAIVNISSTRASMSQSDTESYSAAKGGVLSLTHAIAISLSGKVRVNSISPGWINTSSNDDPASQADHSQHPVKRIGKVKDIANLVLFLCSENSSFINGENIIVDGGMSKLMIYHGEYGWKYEA